MRDDMARVIVERPRHQGRGTRKGRARPPEDLPKQEGVRRQHILNGGRRWPNENLAPLRRYLDKQVGRPWDKVYAEISAGLSPDNVTHRHVRDHLEDFVAIKPRRGIRSSYHWGGRRSADLWHQPLYVDPRDGILKRTANLPEEKARRRKAAAARRAPPPVERIVLAADRELRCLDGIWYEVRLAPLPEPKYATISPKLQERLDATGTPVKKTLVTPPVTDLISGKAIPVGPDTNDPRAWAIYRRNHPDRRYAVAKRQASSGELRRHGLVNREPAEG
jgi:hypothetical protein